MPDDVLDVTVAAVELIDICGTKEGAVLTEALAQVIAKHEDEIKRLSRLAQDNVAAILSQRLDELTSNGATLEIDLCCPADALSALWERPEDCPLPMTGCEIAFDILCARAEQEGGGDVLVVSQPVRH